MEQYYPVEMAAPWLQTTTHSNSEMAKKSLHPVTVADLWDESEQRRASMTNTKSRPKANYRPVSLRWWYVTGLILVILGVAGAVVYAMIALRGTKSTGTVETRDLGHDEIWMLYRDGLEKRQESVPSDVPPAEDTGDTGGDPAGDTQGGDDARIEPPANDGNKLTTARVEVTTAFTSTGPPITEVITTSVLVTTSTEIVTTFASFAPGPVVTIFPTEEPDPSGPAPEPSFSTGPSVEVMVTGTRTVDQVLTVASELTTTKPGERFVQYGKTVISSTFTVDRQGRKVEGAVTAVVTKEVGGTVITSVEQPQPTVFETIGVDGLPTTITSMLQPITHISSVPPTKTTLTSVSAPTASGDVVIVEGTEYEITPASYFIGKFLPPLVSVLLALAIRAVDLSAKLYQPFAALSHPLGAQGRDSLTLHFEGWKGFWRPFGLLSKGHPVVFFSTVAVWLSSAALTPVATEAIRLDIQGRCKASSIKGCAVTLGVAPQAAYVLLGLLGALAVLLGSMLVAISRRWKTGVFADPWCVAGAAALVRNPDVRAMVSLDSYGAVKAASADKRFCLGWYRRDYDGDSEEEYGLVLCDETGRSLRGSQRREASVAMLRDGISTDDGVVGLYGEDPTPRTRKPPSTFAALTIWWRMMFLVYMLGLTGFIIYYHLGINVPDELEDLLQEEKFGRRFVASLLGMIVVLCWEFVFDSIAILAPYRRMARGPQKSSLSVLAGRPIYAVTGIFTGIRERDLLLFSTAAMAVLSDFLPMLFANVPYDLTQTELVHLVCARLSAGLLVLMSVVLILSMFARWPELPVDPRSVAGQMWYVAEARWAIDKLEGANLMDDRERRELFNSMGGRWYYGTTRTEGRMGVEMEDTYGLMEYEGLRPSDRQSRGTVAGGMTY